MGPVEDAAEHARPTGNSFTPCPFLRETSGQTLSPMCGCADLSQLLRQEDADFQASLSCTMRPFLFFLPSFLCLLSFFSFHFFPFSFSFSRSGFFV